MLWLLAYISILCTIYSTVPHLVIYGNLQEAGFLILSIVELYQIKREIIDVCYGQLIVWLLLVCLELPNMSRAS